MMIGFFWMKVCSAAIKRTNTKTSLSVSTSNSIQIKPATSLTSSQWYKWKRVEGKQSNQDAESFHLVEETKGSDLLTPPPTPPLAPEIEVEQKSPTPAVPEVIAVPSYRLRSTAVCTGFKKESSLLERSQSIHADVSIFQYYLPNKSTTLPVKDPLSPAPIPEICVCSSVRLVIIPKQRCSWWIRVSNGYHFRLLRSCAWQETSTMAPMP